MNLRSLTGFVALTDPLDDSPLQAFARLARAGRDRFTQAGFTLQTTRVATQSISELGPNDPIRTRSLAQFARDLQAACQANDIGYAALGAARGDERGHPGEQIADEIAAAVMATDRVFGAVQIAADHTISFGAIRTAARAIHQLGHSTPEGFSNLRFAALAQCAPHSPYFPAAYHDGTRPAFALATEGAPLAVEAFTDAANLDRARGRLISAIENECSKITPIAKRLEEEFSFRFAGIDFSMAPYPGEAHSIGAAIERLTGANFGEHGTLFAAAFITDCIQRARFPRTGFSGVFLPVLEDTILGARSSNLSLQELLLYSSVCGTGLDTIPLPGETTQEAIAAILLDLATLAVKLDKPLTARLLPIPGLHAGDRTNFQFEYFADAWTMKASARAVKFMTSNASVSLVPRTNEARSDAGGSMGAAGLYSE